MVAQRTPEVAFTSLAHHIDLQWLEEAYRRVRKDGSAGIDDVTGNQYAENLQENLQNLLDRLQSVTYKAPLVKRGHIPKGTGEETRPIGIPTFEDKIAQRAVVMLLEPIYEHDFYDSSFGFRPKRSAHQALQTIWEATMESRTNGFCGSLGGAIAQDHPVITSSPLLQRKTIFLCFHGGELPP
jgi:retron-type reverse transcriptase